MSSLEYFATLRRFLHSLASCMSISCVYLIHLSHSKCRHSVHPNIEHGEAYEIHNHGCERGKKAQKMQGLCEFFFTIKKLSWK